MDYCVRAGQIDSHPRGRGAPSPGGDSPPPHPRGHYIGVMMAMMVWVSITVSGRHPPNRLVWSRGEAPPSSGGMTGRPGNRIQKCPRLPLPDLYPPPFDPHQQLTPPTAGTALPLRGGGTTPGWGTVASGESAKLTLAKEWPVMAKAFTRNSPDSLAAWNAAAGERATGPRGPAWTSPDAHPHPHKRKPTIS